MPHLTGSMNRRGWRRCAAAAAALLAGALPPAQAADARQPAVVCTTSADGRSTECLRAGAIDPARRPPPVVARPLLLYLPRMTITRDPRSGSAGAGLLGQVMGQAPSVAASLAPLEQLLAADRQAGDLRAQVADLGLIAGLHIRSGRHADARRRLDEGLEIARRTGEPDAEGAMLAAAGVLAAVTGDYAEALRATQAASQRYDAQAEALKRPAPAADKPDGKASLADRLRLLKERLAAAGGAAGGGLGGAAAQVLRPDEVAMGRELTRLNLGAVLTVTGRFAEAEAAFQQALALYPPGTPSRGTGTILQARAAMLRLAGRTEQAEADERLAQAAGESLIASLSQTGDAPIALQRTAAVSAPAPAAVAGAAPPVVAPVAALETTEVARQTAANQLAVYQAAATRFAAAGQREQALGAWRQAAAVAAATEAASARSAALTELQQLAAVQRQPELSVYYGKRAVNDLQAQRARLGELGRDQRNAFAARARQTFEGLALALMDLDRLAEAEQALKLMREDASADFVRLEGRMPYSSAESALLADDDAQATRWKAQLDARQRLQAQGGPPVSFSSDEEAASVLGQQVALLEQQLGAYEAMAANPATRPMLALQLPVVQQQVEQLDRGGCGDAAPDPRLGAVKERLKRLQATLGPAAGPSPGAPGIGGRLPLPAPGQAGGLASVQAAWCNQREGAAIARRVAASSPELLKGLQGGRPVFSPADLALLDAGRLAVAAAPPGTVSLQYLAGPERLKVLVVGPQSRTVREVAIDRNRLDAQARQFRAALGQAASDPTELARALYATLLAPVAADLDRLKAKTLLLALDAGLRYLPFAALHDGERWLVERYALAHGGPARLKGMAAGRRDWRMAAFGASVGEGRLPALPGVESELAALVGGAGQAGALPGQVYLNAAFTAESLRDALGRRYPVVHIASHFVLDPADADASYLLLGDTRHLSLKAIRDRVRFDGVELLTLSACETGRDARNDWGQEFEGLSNIFRAQGAASVVATLWKIDDVSTPKLMRSFYAGLVGRDPVSKAQALQAAQLSLARPAGGAVGAAGAASATGQRGGAFDDEPAATPQRSLGTAHPYFWAPFVLMGDWL